MIDPKTPADVLVCPQARKPVTDPTLGIRVQVNKRGNPPNRLVAIGDSLTHGFQSGAIFNTKLSYPAIIAREMGWGGLRFPTYESPGDGLPINLESLARELERRFGSEINALDFAPALLFLRRYLDDIEDYWERGAGSYFPIQKHINHNLAVYGWDLRNTISRNADICIQVLNDNPPDDDYLRQIVENHNERAAIRVLNSARNSQGKALSPVQAAAELSAGVNTDTEGIETLIVLIGANNALGSILTFNVVWSDRGYDDMDINDQYTVWRPVHFKAELDKLVAEIKKIRARHVILGTVPHVTITPFARGVDGKINQGSRYFPYYTLPWISDAEFDPDKHPRITEQEARAIDSAIDQYNDYITDAVLQARQEGRDWYLFEAAGLLDRLASRRYLDDPHARPDWWEDVGGAYKLPPELQKLNPVPDARLFKSGPGGRTQGGLFSLDGIHPTTIGYGIMAQEIIKIMQLAGVKFFERDEKTERTGEIKVNFNRLIEQDTLISNPPKLVNNILEIVATVDNRFNIISNMLRSSY
jgi:lysophospholipase L1-like esterase